MEKLFDDSLFIQKLRPTSITEAQEEELYLRLAKEIVKFGYSEDSIEEIVDDLKELCEGSSGFEMAVILDKTGGNYTFSGDFINFLDSMFMKRSSILRENVVLWVQAHNPKPKFIKGTKLKVNKTLNSKIVENDIVYVTGLNHEQAYYTLDENPNRQGGTIIIYEKAEECCEVFK